MRERLICLIKNAEKAFPKDKPVLDIEEFVADYLLANGVIVPPCKVGEVVWIIDCYTKIQKCEIFSVNYYNNRNDDMWLYGIKTENFITLTFEDDDIGKTVFLAKEEARKEFAERVKTMLQSEASFCSMTKSIICEGLMGDVDNLLKEMESEKDA